MIRQVSVFIQNEEGKLGRVLKILEDNNINIRSLNIAETSDYGILRLILSDTDRALAALKEARIMANLTMVMAAEIPDIPGGLSGLVESLAEAKINMSYAYSFLPKKTEDAIIIFRVDDEEMEQVKDILENKKNIHLLERDELLEK